MRRHHGRGDQSIVQLAITLDGSRARTWSEEQVRRSTRRRADDFSRLADHEWSRRLLFRGNSGVKSRRAHRLDVASVVDQGPPMITTLLLELVSPLLSFIGAARGRCGGSFPPASTTHSAILSGGDNRGSPRAALLMQKDTTMTLHFACDLPPTLFVVGGFWNIAFGSPDLHDESDVVRFDRDDDLDQRPLPDWTPSTCPIAIAEGWQL